MVGLSHVGLRLLVRRYMPQGAVTHWPTEMLNSRRLPNETLGQSPETRVADCEDHLVPQLLANEEEPIRRSVERLRSWRIRGIDINMGCPVNKALRHNYGVALMGDLNYASRVIELTVKHAQGLPVSVKLRAGLQNDKVYLKEFVQALEAAGASWLCLHPRLAAQKRRGVADWSQVEYVREHVKIPVIGNGDIQNVEDVWERWSGMGTSVCDGIMVGRALTARPWLMWQVGERLGFPPPVAFASEGRSAPSTPEEEGAEMGRALDYFLDILSDHFTESLAVRRLNFFIRNAHPWLEFGHALAAKVSRSKTINEARTTIQDFFSVPQRMSPRTELRY